MDDFSGYPATIGEMRSDKSGQVTDWGPRDLLITLLRQIDQGKLKADAMVVSWTEPLVDGTRSCYWNACSPDPLVTAGMLQRTIAHIVSGA